MKLLWSASVLAVLFGGTSVLAQTPSAEQASLERCRNLAFAAMKRIAAGDDKGALDMDDNVPALFDQQRGK